MPNFLHNANKDDDLKKTHQCVEEMEQTIRRVREVIGNQAGGSKPTLTPTEVGNSIDDGTKVQLSDEPMFGFHFRNEEQEVHRKRNDNDFSIIS